ncbi:acetate--CoA ligase family protein [Variovorax terrae]|uniref:Acetate--CoA ligase family protein n=1 Tax=Variovorax terrae TaxID=2923278 RepID=A0A9X1VSS2_9BURK|nr:acetate--CoA ligase family protein [Variovorax terrae]MCJ0762270.1 acetate--CoA ligase family protein [Variovorax terrae]
MTTPSPIDTILNPGSVAILGASDDLAKWGGSMLALLKKFEFPGKIFPVNPRSPVVQSLPAFPSVTAIGQPVDVALLAVPHERAIEAFEDCARAGVKAILMVTSQFAESGEAGQKLQDTLVDIARRAGIRIIGPNCMGYFHSHANLCLLNAQALMRNPVLHKGSIALISQSGALAGAMLARAYDLGAGFSFCVSLGNQADLEVCDFLEYAISDPQTRVISLYIEGVKSPQRFIGLLRQARAAGKPVLLVKAGRTDSGKRAVQSHTASMAGAYQAFEAAVRYESAVVVDDFLELVMQAVAWTSLPPPTGRSIAVFSGSGGGGAVASDLVDEAGLETATLSPGTVQALAPLMPESCAHLPFDLGAVPASHRGTNAQWLQEVIVGMMADPGIGAGIFVMTTQPDMVGAARTVMAASQLCGKPVVFVNAASSCGSEATDVLRAAGMVRFESIREATRYLANRLAFEQRAGVPLLEAPAPAVPAVAAMASGLPVGLMSEYQTKQLFAAAGIPVTAGQVARSADEAASAARAIGFPVVMKLMSAQVSHKSDIGGVVLNVRDEAAVRQNFGALQAALAPVPGATFDGCLVQQMAQADAELLVGTHWDAQFGPMLMFGFGGTLVELQRDTALLPASASRPAIAEALAGLRLYPLLTGFRGREPADLERLVDLIHRMGQLAVQLGEQLAECEANPVMVRGNSIVVADARAVWKEKA